MIRLRRSLSVSASLDQVWAILADYDQDPRWRAGVSAMHPVPHGPVVPGTRTIEHLRTAGRSMVNEGLVLVVTAGADVRSFTWRTTSGAQAEGSRTVAVVDLGCEVVLELRVRTTGFDRALAPLFSLVLGRALTADLRRLRTLLKS